MSKSNKTIGDLISYAMRAQRLCPADYGGAGSAYNSDRYRIKKAKAGAKAKADWWWHRTDEPLVNGEYYGTRLEIKDDSIYYCAGQYEPTEIWWAIADYFHYFRRDLEAQHNG
jgi:hypothetical protein